MSWDIFVGIAAILGFIISVTTPLLKLNSSITNLNDSVQVIKEALDRIQTDNENGHRRIWNHNDEQDSILKDHENRLVVIETTMTLKSSERD